MTTIQKDDTAQPARHNTAYHTTIHYHTTQQHHNTMSAQTDKRLCVVSREISNFYNLEGCSQFQCPKGTVLCGLSFDFEHPEFQQFQYGTIVMIDDQGYESGVVSFSDVQWSEMIEDSEIGYEPEEGRFIVGLKIYILSGKVTFKVATVQIMVDGEVLYFHNRHISPPIIVDDVQNWFVANEDCVITGIHIYRSKDKDMVTGYFCYGQLTMSEPKRRCELPFDVVVAMHPQEKYYPMNPSDYIRISRLRKRHDSSPGPDPCYDRRTRQFEALQQNSASYYDIPVSVINGFHSYEPHKMLYNLRPHDTMSLKENQVYLQPMCKLRGVHSPNGRAPVYTRSLTYNLIGVGDVTYYDLWMFFGYNHDIRKGISFSHQGDWQHVMVKASGGKIIAAWMSQHNRFVRCDKEDLEITQTQADGRQLLRIYCAGGSHALYPTEGQHPLMQGLSSDHTQGCGYQWKITDYTEQLQSQPWVLFSGAWGEVGEFSHSTGALGPWYRRFDFWYEDKVTLEDLLKLKVRARNLTANNITKDDHITKEDFSKDDHICKDDIIIVADETLLTTPFEQSHDDLKEGPEGTVLVGIKHCGDENGESRCVYSSLKAIDTEGNTVVGKVEIQDAHWDYWFQQSNSHYLAPKDYVILDRQHIGDENGKSRFKIGRITFDGRPANVISADHLINNQEYVTSQGVFFRTSPNFLMVGSDHRGDENGITVNFQAVVRVRAKADKVNNSDSIQ